MVFGLLSAETLTGPPHPHPGPAFQVPLSDTLCLQSSPWLKQKK